jgi:hypothetical protein
MLRRRVQSLDPLSHRANERTAKVFMGAFCALHEIAGPGSVKQIGFAGEQVPFDFVGDSWSVSRHSSPITPSCADPGENKRKLRNPGACSIRREIKYL